MDLTKGKVYDIYEEESEESNVLHAIRSYYGALINYLLVNLKAQFEGAANVPKFPAAPDLALEIFPPINEPNNIPKGPPNEKPTMPPIKLPQIDINKININ